MITFYFDGGAVLTMRTSGTEPKIKFYSEMIGRKVIYFKNKSLSYY